MKLKSLFLAAPLALVALGSIAQQQPGAPAVGSIVRLDPAFDELVPKDARIEKVAGGFTFTEGPLWRPDGHLWFSDVVGNMVRSLTPDGRFTVLIDHSGGNSAPPPGSYFGSNALIADKDGGILMCQHFNRQIARVDRDLKISTLVDRFEGKRLNSPNDLVYKMDGSLYFTDPPFGLSGGDRDPAKELQFNGVFRYAGGKLQAIIQDLSGPNGLAFSPDEKVFYVSNFQPRRYWMRYDVAADGTVSNGKVFADVSDERDRGGPDGMKVDARGNVYGAGPAGIWVFSPDGKHLGTLKTPENPSNCNWGDDGKTLYITAVTSVYRVKLSVAGKKALY